jgi:hypothetical protein
VEELRVGNGGGEQRSRTKRVRSSLSTEDKFKKRWLQKLGADLIEHVAIAAKGNGAKVVQLLDYVNDRPEMRKLRDGRRVGTEVECMANVRSCSCIALLRAGAL